ncbi:Esterase ybfF [Klebsiella grimontii]|uniref:Esterase ybfF n=1 Tax=Klebsiella grimontii TaxID=2058152 RepID=A0A7H4P7T1_9ENTR|nr:Esterase ybfF [Klebsiella grimontii]
MRQHLNEEGVIQFLLKSFVDGQWRFNVPVLWEQYDNIVGWQAVPAWPHPALFIPGGNSPTSPTHTATHYWLSFPKRARTLSPAPGTGCMPKNRRP